MPFLVLSLFVQLAAAQPGILRTFEDDKIGGPPVNFTLAAGREATSDGWSIKRDGAGRVLAHTGAGNSSDGFSVAVHSPGQFQEVDISVRLKAAGGSRVAGLVWKYQDGLNHYSAQLDLARQEIAIFRVAAGNRIRLEREDDLELDPDAWHTLRVVQEHESIRVYLGGIRVFSERDRNVRVPGGVGLWSSRDTTVMFDDFRVRPTTSESGKGQ